MTTLNQTAVQSSLTAQNTFTEVLPLRRGERATISISGLSDSTVTLQRRLDGANWRDVENWVAPIETDYLAGESHDVRLGIKTGNYGSDTVVCRLGKGGAGE